MINIIWEIQGKNTWCYNHRRAQAADLDGEGCEKCSVLAELFLQSSEKQKRAIIDVNISEIPKSRAYFSFAFSLSTVYAYQDIIKHVIITSYIRICINSEAVFIKQQLYVLQLTL